jgi:hypothetical protein
MQAQILDLHIQRCCDACEQIGAALTRPFGSGKKDRRRPNIREIWLEKFRLSVRETSSDHFGGDHIGGGKALEA